jgi:hypothetical protein
VILFIFPGLSQWTFTITLIELGDLVEDDAVELLRIHREEEAKNELFIGANRSNKDFVEVG